MMVEDMLRQNRSILDSLSIDLWREGHLAKAVSPFSSRCRRKLKKCARSHNG